MTSRILSHAIMSVVRVAVGGLSLAAFVGCIWALLSASGALVTKATIYLGGKAGMWSSSVIFNSFAEAEKNLTYANIGIGFLISLIMTVCLGYITLQVLARLGESVLRFFSKAPTYEDQAS